MRMIKSTRSVFLGLFVAFAALAAAPATAAPGANSGYTVSTPIYRLVPGYPQFLQVTYRVKADCDAQALSHWVLAWNFECIPCSAIVGSYVSATNPGSGLDFGEFKPVVCGYDPTTGVTGIKWDDLSGPYAPEKCKEAYYTLIIDLTDFEGELINPNPGPDESLDLRPVLTNVKWATKSGRFTGIDYGTICAPACIPTCR